MQDKLNCTGPERRAWAVLVVDRDWEEVAEDLSLLLLLLPHRQEEWDFSAAADSCLSLLRDKPVQTLGP